MIAYLGTSVSIFLPLLLSGSSRVIRYVVFLIYNCLLGWCGSGGERRNSHEENFAIFFGFLAPKIQNFEIFPFGPSLENFLKFFEKIFFFQKLFKMMKK